MFEHIACPIIVPSLIPYFRNQLISIEWILQAGAGSSTVHQKTAVVSSVRRYAVRWLACPFDAYIPHGLQHDHKLRLPRECRRYSSC